MRWRAAPVRWRGKRRGRPMAALRRTGACMVLAEATRARRGRAAPELDIGRRRRQLRALAHALRVGAGLPVPGVGEAHAAEWIAAHPLPPTTYAVIVTRGHRHDLDTLRSLATKPARYVGLIGSRAKVKLLFDTLAAEGVSPESLGRVHAPIGLDIGAITPQEIAVSILAEVIAVKHGKAAGASAAPISLKWDVPLAAADS